MTHNDLLPETSICPYCDGVTKVKLLYDEHHTTEQMELEDFICVMAICQFCTMIFRVVIDPIKCLSHQCQGCESMKRGK